MAQRGGREADRRARGEATRQELIDAARALFAESGYVGVSVADVVERSGVGTRGAFYHHFTDKKQLFEAAFRDVEKDLVLRSIADPPAGEPWARLVEGLHRFLDASLEPDVQRIMLIDAPAVLGWEVRRAIEASSIAAIEAVLQGAMDEGTIEALPASVLAHVVSAAVEEAALLVAHAHDQVEARRNAGRVLDQLLAGLAPNDRSRTGARP